MIESIQLLRNTGTFDNVSSGAQLPLSRFALIYAENARGKTTLSTILRSLGSGDPQPIIERKRLGSQHPPHIVIATGGNAAVFQNGAWTSSRPEIFVYDDHFVADNVHSGMEVEADHRQNLHELIIGEQGIALNATLQGHVTRIEEHNKVLQTKAAEIPASIRGDLDVDAFCALANRDDIDAALRDAESNLAAGRDADAIRREATFAPLALPTFDLSNIERLLGHSLPDLEEEAASVAGIDAHDRNLISRRDVVSRRKVRARNSCGMKYRAVGVARYKIVISTAHGLEISTHGPHCKLSPRGI